MPPEYSNCRNNLVSTSHVRLSGIVMTLILPLWARTQPPVAHFVGLIVVTPRNPQLANCP